MTRPPTIAQLHNLADRAGRGPLTADEITRLRDGINQLDTLQQIARGYCPACGRGDAAPTVADWQTERRRAERAEAERDSLGREADRLRKDWVEIRGRAERAEAALVRPGLVEDDNSVTDIDPAWTPPPPGDTREQLPPVSQFPDELRERAETDDLTIHPPAEATAPDVAS